MAAQIIDGRVISVEVTEELKAQVEILRETMMCNLVWLLLSLVMIRLHMYT